MDTEITQITRPNISEIGAKLLIEKVYGINVVVIKTLSSFYDKNYFVQANGDTWTNRNINEICSFGYVFKMLNAEDSKLNHVEAEHEIQMLLSSRGFNCPIPVSTIEGDTCIIVSLPVPGDTSHSGDNKAYHRCMLQTFLPGITLHGTAYKENVRYNVGVTLARIQETLKDYRHDALVDWPSMWIPESVPRLKDILASLREPHHTGLLYDVIARFEKIVLSQSNKLRKGVIHGDFNDQNIIISPDLDALNGSIQVDEISGFIDFGDMSESFYIWDVAVCIMYVMESCQTLAEALMAARHALAGFQSVRPLWTSELGVLRECVAARYAQTLIMNQHTHEFDPENGYIVCGDEAEKRLGQLESLWKMPKKELYQLWGIN